ncbi:centrosomal protein of 85 kDa isoform X4 [Ascaphus truei]
MPSTLGTCPGNTCERMGAPRSADPSLYGYPSRGFHFLPSSDPSGAEDPRKFETPNIEPTLNQSGLLDTFCADPRPRGPEGGVFAETEPFRALPESRATAGGEQIRRAGPPGATHGNTYPNSQTWRPEPYSLQPGAELSAWRQQQHMENMRLRVEQLQLMRGATCPPSPVYPSGLHLDPSQWERVLKASEGVLLEKEMLVERQRQHISQLEQKLREGELQVHSALLSQANPYGDVCMIRLQELQREVTFLRAQFADKTDSSSREKVELERKLCASEAEARGLREAMREASQKHTEDMRKQEERVKGRDKHINNLKKKCQKEAEQNREKQQRIETLERYLADLPTVQNHQRQTQELKQVQEKSGCLQEQVSELERKLGEARAACREREAQLEAEKRRGQELVCTVNSLQVKVEGEEQKRLVLEAEDLRQEMQTLQKERECLRKVVESQQKKMEQMCSQVKGFEEQVSQEEGAGQALKEEVERKEAALRQLRAAVKELAEQNQDLMERNVTLQERLRQEGESEQPAGEAPARSLISLHGELTRCLQDLQSLCSLLSQRAQGRDPNLSLLLGIHSAPTSDEQEDPLNPASLERRLTEARQLQGDIEELRTIISDRYAQDMGDNCTTQ